MERRHDYRFWLFVGMLALGLSMVASVGSVLELVDVPWAGVQFNPGSPGGAGGRGAFHAIAAFRPGGVTQVVAGAPAAAAGIQLGDRVVDVDGIAVDRVGDLHRHSEDLRIGYVVSFRVERDGSTIEIPVVLETPLKSMGFVLGLISGFVGAIVFGVIAVIVLVKRPQDSRARLFYVMSIVFAGAYLLFSSVWSMQMSGLGIADPQAWGARYWIVLAIYLTAAILLGPLLLHFVLVFPRERPILRNRRTVLAWIYSLPFLHPILGVVVFAYYWFRSRIPGDWNPDPIALVILVAAMVWVARDVTRAARLKGWRTAVRDRPVAGMTFLTLFVFGAWLAADLVTGVVVRDAGSRDILNVIIAMTLGVVTFVVIALYYPIATCVALRRSYREADAEERAQVRWPTWGTIIALAGVTLLAVAGFASSFFGAGNVSSVWADAIQKALYLLIPLTFAFAILKYRLMDIELILRKAAVYSVFTGLVLVLYLALAGGLGGLLAQSLGVEGGWLFLMSVLVVGAVLVPVRNQIQSFVDRRFFRSRFDYPETLQNLSVALRTETGVPEIARAVATQVQEAVRSRAVMVFVRQGSRNSLKAAAKIGLPDETLEMEITAGLEPLRDGGEVVEEDVLADALRASARAARAQWLVPVRRAGELLGLITLGRKLSASAFDDDDRSFCTAVAELVAVALENAILRERGGEIDRALEIQRHLLPTGLPRIEGYDLAAHWQPSRTVGGDYYDCLDLGGGRFGLCIADVSGKGIPAALLMSNVQAAVRALAPVTESPAELCRQLNDILGGSSGAGAFVSLFYGVLDPRDGLLRFSNAGHNQPVLLRADGTAERLVEGGMVLGAFPERAYVEGQVRLESGDRLVLFTDGITEAESVAGEEFGETRLIEMLRSIGPGRTAVEIDQAIREAVNVFSAGDFRDDATLVAVVAV